MKALRDKLALVTAVLLSAHISFVVRLFFIFLLMKLEFKTQVGKESTELSIELRTLERQSLSSSHSVGLINEALELYQKHDTTEMFLGSYN